MSLLSRPHPAVVLDVAFISVGDLGSDRAWSVAGKMNWSPAELDQQLFLVY